MLLDTELVKVIFQKFRSIGALNVIIIVSVIAYCQLLTYAHRVTFPAKAAYSVQVIEILSLLLKSTCNDYCVIHWGKDGCSGLLQNCRN